MGILVKFLTIGAILVLGACTNAAGNGGAESTGAGSPTAGSASDPSSPSSPAFFQQSVGDRVLFKVNESTFTDEARSILNGQAQWLLANADYNAVIEGHADEQGTREYNLALGARRANAAREFLMARGVSGDRLKVLSYGKERPIEICSEESCYAKNRRAVTVLSSGLTG